MDLWTLVLILLIGGVCLGIGMQLRPLAGGARDMQDAADALENALARANDLVVAIRALTRELEKTGADVAAQSAEHLQGLKSAMGEADKRITALVPPQAPAPADDARPASPPAADSPADRGGRVDLTVGEDGAGPSEGQGRMAERYETVYRLADQGHTVQEIAQHVHAGKGEVELILSLRRSR